MSPPPLEGPSVGLELGLQMEFLAALCEVFYYRHRRAELVRVAVAAAAVADQVRETRSSASKRS